MFKQLNQADQQDTMRIVNALEATVTATVWVECSDETEARSIAESAWQPRLDGACIDPTIEAIYDYDVDTYAGDTYTTDVEQVQP